MNRNNFVGPILIGEFPTVQRRPWCVPDRRRSWVLLSREILGTCELPPDVVWSQWRWLLGCLRKSLWERKRCRSMQAKKSTPCNSDVHCSAFLTGFGKGLDPQTTLWGWMQEWWKKCSWSVVYRPWSSRTLEQDWMGWWRHQTHVRLEEVPATLTNLACKASPTLWLSKKAWVKQITSRRLWTRRRRLWWLTFSQGSVAYPGP